MMSDHKPSALPSANVPSRPPGLERARDLGFFERYLTVWVLLCMAAGIGLGALLPGAATALNGMTIANVNVPVAVFLFAMMYPIMVQIDFSEVVEAVRNGVSHHGRRPPWRRIGPANAVERSACGPSRASTRKTRSRSSAQGSLRWHRFEDALEL